MALRLRRTLAPAKKVQAPAAKRARRPLTEYEKFERRTARVWPDSVMNFMRDNEGYYMDPYVAGMWHGWCTAKLIDYSTGESMKISKGRPEWEEAS